MTNPKKGRWALISDGSSENLARFFRGCREQGIETQGVVINCPEGDFDFPPNWKPWKQIDKSFPSKPGDEWFGILWSDQCPQSPKWDVQLINEIKPWNVVTSADGIEDWRRGAIVWGSDILKSGGYLNFQNLDNELSCWQRSAAAANCWFAENVLLPRRDGPALTWENRPFTDVDPVNLSACMEKHGVKVLKPDYTGVSLLISTPSIGKMATEYVFSLMATMRELANMGVPVEWTLERWNADIVMARSHILAEFMAGKHTHLLMIDDDMTWTPQAIHRLFYAKKDVVAVAGPKKSYPLRFAASKVDEDGKPIPFRADPETGVAEVDFVGCAFMLVTRQAVERMIAAYPETAYIGADGKQAYALFLQHIEDNRYFPEDFSFCQRWRKIGGEVFIASDVSLGHVGEHEYKGNLLESCQPRPR